LQELPNGRARPTFTAAGPDDGWGLTQFNVGAGHLKGQDKQTACSKIQGHDHRTVTIQHEIMTLDFVSNFLER
jgi:hypothetical protein